jgi:hypothetical protein
MVHHTWKTAFGGISQSLFVSYKGRMDKIRNAKVVLEICDVLLGIVYGSSHRCSNLFLTARQLFPQEDARSRSNLGGKDLQLQGFLGPLSRNLLKSHSPSQVLLVPIIFVVK